MTPPELSPAKAHGEWKFNPNYDFGPAGYQPQSNNALLFETDPQNRYQELLSNSSYRPSVVHSADPFRSSGRNLASFEPFAEGSLYAQGGGLPRIDTSVAHRQDATLLNPSWSHQRLRTSSADWMKAEDRRGFEAGTSDVNLSPTHGTRTHATAHEVSICACFVHSQLLTTTQQPINFLSLLHPSSSPPYPLFVSRIIKSSDQQASIFLQQKLKVADGEERGKIVDAICARGFEMMAHRYAPSALQRTMSNLLR